MTAIHYQRQGEGRPLLLLHATLSSSRQLRSLASLLSRRFSVLSVDRRGSGQSAGEGPASPIDVATHVADLLALCEAERIGSLVAVGHSYGGCLALELAARQPHLVQAVFAYEPPYAPLAPAPARRHMEQVGRRTLEINASEGPAAAALAFMAGVSGPEAVAALSPGARERVGSAGQGAVADATLLGMDPDGLAAIACPTRIASGAASDPLYAQIAEALVGRISGATHVRLADVDHMAPILAPDIVASAVATFTAAIERA